eukprot:GHVL01005829.1.p1 GENE.GHVL01005829.1~~GHVL01005829.1.p1  ORF type:complete len:517 (+),score=92.39 GHVL01005829.1:422-1972(+)
MLHKKSYLLQRFKESFILICLMKKQILFFPVLKSPQSMKSPLNDSSLRFCCVGSVYPRKNQLQLVRCFTKILEENFELDVVGLRHLSAADIEYGNQCKALADLDKKNRIRLHEPTLNVDEFYRKSDVFILLSHEEVSPVTIMEAAARGLPTIAKRVGGIPELVKDGVTGILLTPEATDDEVITCLKDLFANKWKVRKMSLAARKRAQDVFADEIFKTNFLEVMKDVRSKVFLIDMDNTLLDWDGEFLRRWSDNGYSLNNFDRKLDFEIEKCFSENEVAKVMGVLAEDGFFEKLKPLPGAIESLGQLQAVPHVEVFLCTSPHPCSKNCAAEKIRWVQNNLPVEFHKRVIITYDKTLVFGDFLLDDKPSIRGVNNKPAWTHIVYSQPYNNGVFTWANGVQDLLDLGQGTKDSEMYCREVRWSQLKAEVDALPDFRETLKGTEYYRGGYKQWRSGKPQGAKGEPEAAVDSIRDFARELVNMAGGGLVDEKTALLHWRNNYSSWRTGQSKGAKGGVTEKF